jgi:hypothetical protein
MKAQNRHVDESSGQPKVPRGLLAWGTPSRIPIISALTAVTVFTAITCGWARTVRVHPEGLGDFTSVQAAVTALEPGDTCVVTAGNYPERIKFPGTASGQSSAWTRLQAESDVTILGIDTGDCDYLRIEGFTVRGNGAGTEGSGIEIRSSHVEVISNQVYDFTVAGIAGMGGEILLRGNQIFGCGSGVLIAGNNWRVEDNRIERLRKFRSSDVDYIRIAGQDHVLRRNQFSDSTEADVGDGSAYGFQMVQYASVLNRRWVIEDNELKGFYRTAVRLVTPGRDAIADMVVRNNVIIAPAEGAVELSGFIRDAKIYNNTIINPGQFGVSVRDQSSAEVKNNVFYSERQDMAESQARDLTYVADATSLLVAERNLICVPGQALRPEFYPRDLFVHAAPFVSLRTGNYRLRPGNVGIDGGVPLTGFNADREGMLRPQGAGWDVGAYEFPHSRTNRPKPPANMRTLVR